MKNSRIGLLKNISFKMYRFANVPEMNTVAYVLYLTATDSRRAPAFTESA
jgi:hypothetical protein